MDKIKFIDIDDSTITFELPWEWLPSGTQGPTLNDLESSGERGKMTGALSRVRCAEIPAATLDIIERLSQAQLYPLLKIIRKPAVYIRYFEKYENKFITKKFYVEKVNPPYYKIPEDNNTDNIIYDKFTINFSGYEDVKVQV